MDIGRIMMNAEQISPVSGLEAFVDSSVLLVSSGIPNA